MRISSRRIGEFLVDRLVLSPDALEGLLDQEVREGRHLTRLLLDERLVSEDDLTAAIACELGVPFVDLAERSIRPDVWNLVPAELARRHLAVAVERVGDEVVVAMEDPGDVEVVDLLSEAIGRRVTPVAAARGQLVRLIDQVHPTSRGGTAAPAGVEVRDVDLDLDALLGEVLDRKASDLHLAAGAAPTVRLGTDLVALDHPPCTASQLRRVMLDLLGPAQRERFTNRGQIETSHALVGRGRFRVSAFVQRHSVGAVIRVVPGEIPELTQLGLPPELVRAAGSRRGLVLVCGPRRSGISTTLAAIVDRINRTRACHVLTIEEPIEFLHRHGRCIVNQREVGEDAPGFASALRHALRQDADVLVLGELPDDETIELALGAAESGHLVVAALRTPDSVAAVQRVVDAFGPDGAVRGRHQLAANLRALVVQQLVPVADGPPALAVELLMPTPAVRSAIAEGDLVELTKAMLGGGEAGMVTMDQALAALVKEGRVAIGEATERAVDPDELRYLVGDR